MFTNIRICNFKAFRDTTIPLSPLTVLIGENSVGKSTVIQALDFLSSIATMSVEDYLRNHGWTFDELRSAFVGADEPMFFDLAYENDDGQELHWELNVYCRNGRISLQEMLWNKEDQEALFLHNIEMRDKDGHTLNNFIRMIDGKIHDLANKRTTVFDQILDIEEVDTGPNYNTMHFNERGELVRNAAGSGKKGDQTGAKQWPSWVYQFDPRIIEFRRALTKTSDFGLLSPDLMRRDSSARSSSIGPGGADLAAYLYAMSRPKKTQVSKLVSEMLGYPVTLHTHKLSLGTIDLTIDEEWPDRASDAELSPRMSSDGLLRMIALAAIYIGNGGSSRNANAKRIRARARGKAKDDGVPPALIMLDEIENGMNPYVTGNVIWLFQQLAQMGTAQVVLTTHSPVLLNFVDRDGIVYLWRTENGDIRAERLFDSEELREKLEYLAPGEVWINYPRDALVGYLDRAADDGDDTAEGDDSEDDGPADVGGDAVETAEGDDPEGDDGEE